MSEIWTIIGQGVSAVLLWFSEFHNSIGGIDTLLLGLFTIIVSYRFILQPLLSGTGSSDTVKKGKKNSNESSN